MKKILILTDTHVGSRYGLNHPDYIAPIIKESSDCLMLYNCFNKVRDQVGKIDYIFHLGDSCDGWNPKEHGDDRTQTEKLQVEAAAKLTKTIKGSPTIYVVEGSGYHNNSRKLDDQYGEEIGAVQHPKYGYYAWPDATIQIEKVAFHLAHAITVSKSTWQYRTTPTARELILALLNDNPAKIILRGHAHYYVYAGFSNSVGMVCPAFQTQTPFMAKISPLSEPRWGAILFTVKNDDFDWDSSMIWEPDMKKEVFQGVKG